MVEPDWRELSQNIFRFFSVRWPHAVAADLTQETLRRVVEKFRNGSIDLDKGSVRSFAFGVAVNVRREAIKRYSREDRRSTSLEIAADPADGRVNPEEHLILKRSLNSLKVAIKQLGSTEQEVLGLLIDQDLSVAEAAKILGMPSGTIKSHMSRAKERLRELLK